MLKNKLKFLSIVLIVILLISTLSYATDTVIQPRTVEGEPVTTSENEPEPISENEPTITNEEIPSDVNILGDDLYLMDSEVTMDKLVDGNVYIFGSNVTISGQVNGNLFVFGNNVKFTSDSMVVYSVYVVANTVEIAGEITDLYVACSTCNVSKDAFIYRDFRSFSDTINFSGNVRRNAHIFAQTLNISDATDSFIYGDLNYYTPQEVSIPQTLVQGNVTHHTISNDTDSENKMTLSDYIVSFCTYLLTTLLLYLFFARVTPKFIENSSNYASSKALLALGIGFLSLIGIPLLVLILFMISIGSTLGFILLALYIALLLMASPIVSISISRKIIEVRKVDNKYMNIFVVACVSSLVWIIKNIPFIGGIANFIILLVGLGIITVSAFAKKNEKSIEKTTEETK